MDNCKWRGEFFSIYSKRYNGSLIGAKRDQRCGGGQGLLITREIQGLLNKRCFAWWDVILNAIICWFFLMQIEPNLLVRIAFFFFVFFCNDLDSMIESVEIVYSKFEIYLLQLMQSTYKIG